MFNGARKKDLETIVKKGMKEKEKSWKILEKFGVGMLSGLRSETLKNVINRQLESIK